MYEHHTRPLLPKKRSHQRLFRNFFWGGIEQRNAFMPLRGTGPADPVTTTAGKIIASFCALFSGRVFLSTIAFVLAPAAHRFLHAFHLEEEKK